MNRIRFSNYRPLVVELPWNYSEDEVRKIREFRWSETNRQHQKARIPANNLHYSIDGIKSTYFVYWIFARGNGDVMLVLYSVYRKMKMECRNSPYSDILRARSSFYFHTKPIYPLSSGRICWNLLSSLLHKMKITYIYIVFGKHARVILLRVKKSPWSAGT